MNKLEDVRFDTIYGSKIKIGKNFCYRYIAIGDNGNIWISDDHAITWTIIGSEYISFKTIFGKDTKTNSELLSLYERIIQYSIRKKYGIKE